MSGEREALLWLAFDEAARAHPGAPAIVDGTTSCSYRELRERALTCSAALGAGSNLIALVAVDPAATLVWMFGGLSAGAAVALIPPSGPDHRELLRLLRPDVTVTCTDDDRGELDHAEPTGAPPLPPGVVVSTAGTTGAPKAVVHSHTTLGHAVRRLQLFRLESAGVTGRVPLDENELRNDLLDAAVAPALGLHYATTLPLTTMAGLTVAFQALLAGESLSLPDASHPEALVETIAALGATNVSLTPLLAQLVLRAATQKPVRKLDRLLFVGIGGGPVAPTLPAQLEAALGCPVAVGYGTTEAGGAVTMGRISDPPELRHHTAGRALPGVRLTVEPDTRELTLHCASTALGRITHESSARADRLVALDRAAYPTGDLARVRSDGAIELLGRTDALILRGGRNIDPVRIERVLERHPAVRRAAAFGVNNPVVAGEQDIWTVVVLERNVAETELRSHCNDSLGASLTPRRVIAVDSLPLTTDGAVRRHELAELADRRAFARARSS